VDEPDTARRRLGEQAGDQAGLQGVEHVRLVNAGRLHQHLDVGVAADDRGKVQHRDRGRRQPASRRRSTSRTPSDTWEVATKAPSLASRRTLSRT
jgi:hypothetical protein